MFNYFTKFMERFLTPVAVVVGRNRYISAIRDAFITFMPFLIAGSIFLIISSFPSLAYREFMVAKFGEDWWVYLEYSFNAVFPLMAIFITFLVAYRLAEHYEIDSISAGMLAIVSFITVTPFGSSEAAGGFIPLEWIGSKGLLVGIFLGIVSTEILRLFIKKNWVIKMPDGVPPGVAKSFSAIVPTFATMILMLIVRNFFRTTDFETIHMLVYEVLAKPIRAVGTSYGGALATVFAITSLWSVGVNSGALVNGILRPFWVENQAENMAALKDGVSPFELPHIVTEQFFDMIWMGGAGVTLALVIIITIFNKSKQNRTIGTLSLAPGVFNINEPVLFGIPVILNPIMLIPFNLVPLILVTTQYFAMSIGIVARPTGVYIPWTTPPILSGFIITGSISGAVMQIINLIIAGLIYLPFIMFIDKQHLKEEKK